MYETLQDFPLRVTLQSTYREKGEAAQFASLLARMQAVGLYGIELNLPHLELISAPELTALLRRYELTMTYLATGAYAKQRGLTLSAESAELRAQAVEGCKSNIRYAAEMHCGIILGFVKSSVSSGVAQSEGCLVESLQQLADFAKPLDVPILLEATNRYESLYANSLEDTARLIKAAGADNLLLLPDTFHMNIEEARPMDALNEKLSLVPNIHFSDNNRYFPGFGHLDFGAYTRQLCALGYRGTLGIEGNIKGDLLQDLTAAVAHLSQAAHKA